MCEISRNFAASFIKNRLKEAANDESKVRWIFHGKVHKKPNLHLAITQNEKEHNALRGLDHAFTGRSLHEDGQELQRCPPYDRGERETGVRRDRS